MCSDVNNLCLGDYAHTSYRRQLPFARESKSVLEMSKETAKKNWRNNVRRMNAFTFITCVVTALYVLVIMFRNGGLPGPWDIVCLSFWAGQEFAALAALKAFAKPSFGADGALVECADVSNPAELGYYTFAQDVLWISWVVQTLCNVHHAFFVFYLPVPATVIYKVWTSFLGPLLMGSSGSAAADQGGSEASPRNRQERRQQELKQRKAARRAGERG